MGDRAQGGAPANWLHWIILQNNDPVQPPGVFKRIVATLVGPNAGWDHPG